MIEEVFLLDLSVELDQQHHLFQKLKKEMFTLGVLIEVSFRIKRYQLLDHMLVMIRAKNMS